MPVFDYTCFLYGSYQMFSISPLNHISDLNDARHTCTQKTRSKHRSNSFWQKANPDRCYTTPPSFGEMQKTALSFFSHSRFNITPAFGSASNFHAGLLAGKLASFAKSRNEEQTNVLAQAFLICFLLLSLFKLDRFY